MSIDRINWPTALFLALTPAVGVAWGAFHVFSVGTRPAEVGAFLFFYAATAMSITAGYHRLFAHRAYECRRLVKIFYVLFGAASFQHSVLTWSSDHRRHHKNIDDEGDPYNIRRGFLYAHIGWLLVNDHKDARFDNVRDLQADPLLRWQHRFYMPIAIAMSFGLPLALGFAVGDPWGWFLWGGLLRVVAVHHSTFFVNSLAHTLGKRPYSLAVSARDSVVTALLTFGEGYHNFHHRFAADYRNGVHRYQWDPTKWFIRAMAAMGWAWNLRRVPRERIVAAELQCDLQRVLERLKDRSEQARAYVRERMSEAAAAVERSAAQLAALEREFARVRQAWGDERRRKIESLRAEMRAARRDFRVARRSWRTALAELGTQPLPQPA